MIKYNSKNLNNARNNRRVRNMTKEERLLWYMFLNGVEPKFYRQYRIDNYIVDFYCPTKKIAIELDGNQHGEDKLIIYDEERTNKLAEFGIIVLRFQNKDVKFNFNRVCDSILNELNSLG